MQKRILRNDLILITVIVFVVLVSFFCFHLSKKEGGYVLVNIDGEVYAEYPIDRDVEKNIVTKYGENKLIIKNGKVYVTQADCPDKICVGHRAISKTGESIVCLPHKLVVTVEEK